MISSATRLSRCRGVNVGGNSLAWCQLKPLRKRTRSSSTTATTATVSTTEATASTNTIPSGTSTSTDAINSATIPSASSALTSSSSSSATTITSNRRSKFEIDRLIQQRVQERNAWLVNDKLATPPSAAVVWNAMKELWWNIPQPTTQLDEEFPVQPLDWSKLLEFRDCRQRRQRQDMASMQVTWLGHASLLLQMGDLNILTDPVWSDRVSPLSFVGPQRYRPPPCSLDEFCHQFSNHELDVVLISHNHYDHLDYPTVRQLHQCFPNVSWVVPLGLGAWFRRHVSPGINLFELDWHEQAEPCHLQHHDRSQRQMQPQQKLVVTSLPMRHWSNRMGDRDQTLWCGYRIQYIMDNNDNDDDDDNNKEQSLSFLFPGDTAWFDGLYEIGQRYGPFDAAALPIGAYEPRDFMKVNHTNVEEAVRMKEAVRAAQAVPIHWGTYPLTTEPILEPRDLLRQYEDPTFEPWLIGETRKWKKITSQANK